MPKMITCRECGITFTLYPKKPGFIDQCASCGTMEEDRQTESGIERLGGNMVYLHKTGAQIEIKPMSEARKFSSKTRRFGAGVTMSLTESKYAHEKVIEGEGRIPFEPEDETAKLSKEYRSLNQY